MTGGTSLSQRFAGRVVVITGAGSGIGDAMARVFADSGAAVAVLDVDESAADRVADAITESGGRALAVRADVTTPDEIDAAVAEVTARLGPIDVLCANAGILDDYAAVIDTSDELWARVIAVNLTGVFVATRSVLPGMVERGRGVIVTTASIAGLVANGGGAAYTASKHGVIGLTRQISSDYGHLGIRANAICPGAVETPMTAPIFAAGDAAVLETVRSVPAGRHAQPIEIANLAAYLASDEASFVHGSTVVIDGGWTVR